MKIYKLLTLMLGLILSSSALAEISVIVNPGNGSTITTQDIPRMFLGKLKRFTNGQAVVALNNKASGGVQANFDKQVLKKSPAQIKAYWSKQLFTGKGKPPKTLGSDQEVLQFVASTPNAIGYVNAANVNDSVKVVASY